MLLRGKRSKLQSKVNIKTSQHLFEMSSSITTECRPPIIDVFGRGHACDLKTQQTRGSPARPIDT